MIKSLMRYYIGQNMIVIMLMAKKNQLLAPLSHQLSVVFTAEEICRWQLFTSSRPVWFKGRHHLCHGLRLCYEPHHRLCREPGGPRPHLADHHSLPSLQAWWRANSVRTFQQSDGKNLLASHGLTSNNAALSLVETFSALKYFHGKIGS